MLRSSVRAGTAAGVPADVTKVVDAATEGTTLLNEILNNLGKGEKLEDNEIATQVAAQLETNFETISKLVPSSLENEKACALLLGVHDRIETALNKYKSMKAGTHTQDDPDTSGESSAEEVKTQDVTDNAADEKFHQEYILPRINTFGNPFNNFLIGQVGGSNNIGSQESTSSLTATPPFGVANPFMAPTTNPTTNPLLGNPFFGTTTANPFAVGPSPYSPTPLSQPLVTNVHQPFSNFGQPVAPFVAQPNPFAPPPVGQFGQMNIGQQPQPHQPQGHMSNPFQ